MIALSPVFKSAIHAVLEVNFVITGFNTELRVGDSLLISVTAFDGTSAAKQVRLGVAKIRSTVFDLRFHLQSSIKKLTDRNAPPT